MPSIHHTRAHARKRDRCHSDYLQIACAQHIHIQTMYVYLYIKHLYILYVYGKLIKMRCITAKGERAKQKVTQREQIPYAESQFELNLFLKFNAEFKFFL